MNSMSKVGLVGLALVLTFAACSKGSQTSSSTTTTESSTAPGGGASAMAMASPGASAMAANGASANDGAKIYQTNCSSCHQATGMGVEGTFPPLAGNPVVGGPATKVIHIVKYGLNGKLEVKGHSYNGMMPPWGQQLSDADIAAVITYVRSAWGNKAGPVTTAQVTAVAQ